MGAFEIRGTWFKTLEVVLRAPNGDVLMVSDPVTHPSEALEVVARIRGHAGVDAYYKRLRTLSGRHVFTLLSDRGHVLGTSPECPTQVELEGLIASVKVNAPDSPVEDRSRPAVRDAGRAGRP